MKTKFIVSVVFSLFITCFLSCDDNSKPRSSRADLERIMRYQAETLLQNNLSMFAAGGNSASIREGGPMNFWFYPPWMYYSMTVSSDVSGDSSAVDPAVLYTDTSYYDPASGYWTYGFSDSNYQWTMRYKFLPHDEEGYPIAETDQYLFETNYSGNFEDTYWGMEYTYSGQSDFQVSGLKDWMDSAKTGMIVYGGNSQSYYSQRFSIDTSVTFTYNEVVDKVTLSEDDCAPRSGSSEFLMTQDATPDTFVFVYRFDDSTFFGDIISFEMPFEDYSYSGKTIYTADGIRYILDGEEFFYEVDCDGGFVTFGKAPKVARRK